MKTFKRVIALLLVSCLMMCAVPSAFAAESADTSVVAETDEENILDNPIFSGALVDIVASFLQSFTEIFNRYVEIIKALLLSLELPELDIPVVPEVPEGGENGEGDVPPAEEQPSEGEGDAPTDDTTDENIQPAA